MENQCLEGDLQEELNSQANLLERRTILRVIGDTLIGGFLGFSAGVFLGLGVTALAQRFTGEFYSPLDMDLALPFIKLGGTLLGIMGIAYGATGELGYYLESDKNKYRGAKRD